MLYSGRQRALKMVLCLPRLEHEQLLKKIRKDYSRRGKNCKIPVESTFILQKWLLEKISKGVLPTHRGSKGMASRRVNAIRKRKEAPNNNFQ